MCTQTRWRVLVVGLMCVFMSACYTTRYVTDQPRSKQVKEFKQIHTLTFLVSDPVDLNKACPNGVSEVQVESTFMDGLLGAITLTLYGPSTVTVTCSQ